MAAWEIFLSRLANFQPAEHGIYRSAISPIGDRWYTTNFLKHNGLSILGSTDIAITAYVLLLGGEPTSSTASLNVILDRTCN